jgi:hypothetical protein
MFSAGQVAGMMLDYNLFAVHVCGFVPDDWQRDVLLHPHRPTMLCTSRQIGKSTTCAILAAATTVLRRNKLSVVISQSREHATHLLGDIRQRINQAEAAGLCRIVSESAHKVTLGNGSSIVSVSSSSKASRGYPVSGVLLLDELAHIERQAKQPHVFDSALPTVSAAGGTVFALSTPNGYGVNRFSQLWHQEDSYWHRIEVPWWDSPRHTKSTIDQLKASAESVEVFEQEFCCNFLTSGSALFDWDDLIQARQGDSPIPASLQDKEDPTISKEPLFGLSATGA